MFKQLPAHVRASSSLKDDVPDLFVLSATAPQVRARPARSCVVILILICASLPAANPTAACLLTETLVRCACSLLCLQRLRAAHGDDAPLSMAASALLSSIMSEVQDSFESISPGRVLHQVLMTHDGGMAAHSSAHQQRRAGRHLLAGTSAARAVLFVCKTCLDGCSWKLLAHLVLPLLLVLLLLLLQPCTGFV